MRRFGGAVAALVLALSAPLRGAAAPPAVARVSYDCDGPVDPRAVASLLEVSAGQPLDPDAVRRSIQNLFGTERFANIVAEELPLRPGRVEVRFHLFLAYLVERVSFSGAPISSGDLARAAGLEPGQPYEQSAVLEGARRVERLLTSEGFADARAQPRLSFDARRFTVSILYAVHAGPATRTGPPIFQGSFAPFSERDLAGELTLRPGDRFRQDQARRGAQRIERYLFEKRRLKADVSLIGVDIEKGIASPVYRVEAGPEVVFATQGVAEEAVRRDFLGLLQGQPFLEDLLVSYVGTLRERYQKEGYHEARVDYTTRSEPGRLVVTLDVDRGPREHVESVAIEGNGSFPDKTLRRLILTRPRGLFTRGYLVDSVLTEDRAAVEGFYRIHGFTEVHVGSEIARGRSAGGLDVVVRVREGPRTKVATCGIEGADHADPAEIRRRVRLAPGDDLNPARIEEDRAAIVAYYRERGWTHADVDPRVSFGAGRRSADVVYRITEGDREFFGKTIVRGNTRTKLARLELPLQFSEGDPFSEAKLLDAQRDLTRTGAFDSVAARAEPPDPATSERNVILSVAEGRPWSLLYGIGYQYTEPTGDQSPFGILGIGYNNLGGGLRTISLESRYAPLTDQGRVFLTYRDPYFFDGQTPLAASLFYAREPIQKIDVDRRGAFLEASRSLTPQVRVGLRGEYQEIVVGSTNPLDTEQLQPFERNVRESTVGATLLYDTRDNPIEPSRGLFLSTYAKYAFPLSALSTETRYVKAYGQLSGYRTVLGGVLAGSLRAGVIRAGGGDSSTIPFAERFFSGGRSSNRGFDANVQGIPGETVDYDILESYVDSRNPVPMPGQGSCRATIDADQAYNCDFGPRILGGSAIGGWNLEWRFPIAGDVGGTLFYDATQVWSDSHIHLEVEGKQGMRQSAGVGLRYRTPVGPVRLEWGWVLHPRTFLVAVRRQVAGTNDFVATGQMVKESEPSYRIYLSIGYPF